MEHVPVLLHEVIDLLKLKAGDVVMDATCGGGGHSQAAGATMQGDLEVIKKLVRKRVDQLIGA
jgi:16S rRNA C1402 N4-methylase RsmH